LYTVLTLGEVCISDSLCSLILLCMLVSAPLLQSKRIFFKYINKNININHILYVLN